MWKKIKRMLGMNVYEPTIDGLIRRIKRDSGDNKWMRRWIDDKPNKKLFETDIMLVSLYFIDTLLYKNGYKLIPYDYDYKTGMYCFILKSRYDEYQVSIHFYDINRFIFMCSEPAGYNFDNTHWWQMKVLKKIEQNKLNGGDNVEKN